MLWVSLVEKLNACVLIQPSFWPFLIKLTKECGLSVRSALKCFLLYKVKRLCQIIVNQRKNVCFSKAGDVRWLWCRVIHIQHIHHEAIMYICRDSTGHFYAKGQWEMGFEEDKSCQDWVIVMFWKRIGFQFSVTPYWISCLGWASGYIWNNRYHLSLDSAVGEKFHQGFRRDGPPDQRREACRARLRIAKQEAKISHFFLLILYSHFLSLSLSYPAFTCKQTHTNELWLNAERLQLAAKETDQCCFAAEVSWLNKSTV